MQLDGAATDSADRVLALGATNRPHELDDAARRCAALCSLPISLSTQPLHPPFPPARRFVKRLYIPLPEAVGRRSLVQSLLSKNRNTVTEDQVEVIVNQTAGFSGKLRAVCIFPFPIEPVCISPHAITTITPTRKALT